MLERLAVLGMVLCACGDNVGTSPAARSETAPLLPSPPIAQPPCSEQSTASGIVDRVITYTYDSDGFVTQYENSLGQIGAYTYDANHFVLRFTFADNHEETYTRDAEGRVLSYVEQSAPNAEPNALTYQYDELGRLIRIDSRTTFLTWTYTGESLNPTTGQQTLTGLEQPQVSSFVFTSANDDHTVRADSDLESNGTIDYTVDTTYDDDRRVTDYVVINRFNPVANPDGLIQTREHTEYTADGQVSVEQLAWQDGADDLVYTSRFDSAGVWRDSRLSSPSGAYFSGEYSDAPKTSCALGGEPYEGWRPLPMRDVGRALPRWPGHPYCASSSTIGC